MRRSPLGYILRERCGFCFVTQGFFCIKTMSFYRIKALKRATSSSTANAVPLPRWGRLNTPINRNLPHLSKPPLSTLLPLETARGDIRERMSGGGRGGGRGTAPHPNHTEDVYVTLTLPPKSTYNVPSPARFCANQKNFNIFCNFLSNYLQNTNERGIIINIKADLVEILVFKVAKST